MCIRVCFSWRFFEQFRLFFFFFFKAAVCCKRWAFLYRAVGLFHFFFFGLWCLWRNRTFVFCLLSFPFWWNLLAGIKKREKIPKHKRRNNKIIIWKKKTKFFHLSFLKRRKKENLSFLFEHTFSHVIIDCPVLYGPAFLMCTRYNG